jgi:2-desacetyl-2-hydroxyethyl bacteriochlorophyllide A dehydrogenase
MKAVVLAGVEDVRVEELPDPEVSEPGDAIVEVRRSAICGADLFPYHGHTPNFEYGTIAGHEFMGVVAEVGAGVGRVRPGDRVVCTSTISDGTCAHCRAGRPTQCRGRALFGYSGVYPRLDGGQATLVRVPYADRCLWPLPESVSDEAAVFVPDMLPTGFNAVERGGVAHGDTVVVLGCGTVGLMAVLCAAGRAGRLLAVDGIPARRELAARLGAEPLAPEDAEAAVAEATGGIGADVVIEAAGAKPALDAAFRLARGRGTVSVVGAHFEPDYPLNNLTMFEKELTLRFSIGDSAGHRPLLFRLLAAGRLDPALVVSHRLPLADAAEAYRMFDAREATKVVLVP